MTSWKSTRRKTHSGVMWESTHARDVKQLWKGQRPDVWLLPPLTIDDLRVDLPATIAIYDRYDDNGECIDGAQSKWDLSINPNRTIPATVVGLDTGDADFIARREDDVMGPDELREQAYRFLVDGTWRLPLWHPGPRYGRIGFTGTALLVLFIGERIHEPGALLARSGAYASWPPIGPRHTFKGET